MVVPPPTAEPRTEGLTTGGAEAQTGRLTRRDAVEIAVVNVLTAALAFMSGVALARRYGETGRGELTAVMLWPSLALVLANAGLAHAAAYHVARDPARRGTVVGTAAVASLLSGLVLGGVTFLAVSPLLDDQPPEVRDAARLFTAVVVIQPVLGVLFHPWRVLGRIRRWNWYRLFAENMLFVALAVTVVAASRGYVLLMGAYVLGVLVLTCSAGGQWLRAGERLAFDRRELGVLLAYALPTLLATLPYFLNFRIDQAFLEANTDAAELGRYSVAVGWSLAVRPMLLTVSHLAMPRVAAIGGHQRAPGHIRLGATVAVVVAVPLVFVSPAVVPFVFGEEFGESGRLALVLVPATALLGFASVVEEVLRSLGRPRLPVVAQSAALACTFAALPWATSSHGAWGAAWVSLGAYFVTATVLVRMAGRMCGTPVRSLLLLRKAEWRALWAWRSSAG